MIKIKAIVLAAGYATRLYPLTLDKPKTLLLIGNKPMLNYIIEKIEQINDVSAIYIITNNKFFNQFVEWSKTYKSKKQIKILNDNTNSNEDRLGAIGDINFLINKEKIDEDIIAIGSDNMFEFDLRDIIDSYKTKNAPVTALYDVRTKERAKLYGVVSIDEKNRITSFKEKPQEPESTLISTCIYIYPRRCLGRIKEFLKEKSLPDKPGSLIEWLHKKEDVYGFIFKGEWFDIGTFEELEMVREKYGENHDANI